MKNVAALLMILGIFILLGYGFLYLLGFAMSFDAAEGGSLKFWLLRLLGVLPILILIAALIFAWRAFQSANFRRSVQFGYVFAVAGVAFFILLLYMFI